MRLAAGFSGRLAALALASLTVLPACGSGPATHGHHRPGGGGGGAGSGDAAAAGAPDRAITGPQGGRGQFVVECPLSHTAPDDPIVHPGKPGHSHLHLFFGNVSADAHSTADSLAAASSNCDQPLDRASYWAPALIDAHGAPVLAHKSTAYYRAGLDVDPASVVPYPMGLKMIAGDPLATAPQPASVVAWACGTSGQRLATPPSCAASRKLRLLVTFPDCWNGRDLDSADHRSHVAYSSKGRCPAGHPVAIPQLQFSVEYDHNGPLDGFRLASGPLTSGHADFFNAWDEAKLATEVRLCIGRDTVCGITSGRKSG